jgi:hypothetical protein
MSRAFVEEDADAPRPLDRPLGVAPNLVAPGEG